ncbi:flavin containing amine oxidoreductase domain-containing protein [Ditylenchus destructor]|nr:flavin containing amine oxidoreductase domain-containing protein [Ditylenchus destructor]
MKIVAIGAAPTTLGVAYRLNELKQTNPEAAADVELLILEQESVPGGLSCTVTDEKGFLWDMGGHITFSHNFPYYEKATRWAVDDWNDLNRNCLVDMNYLFDKKGIHLVPYPAQFAVPLFPENIKKECLKDLKERYENTNQVYPENFEDWIMAHFGPTILDIFFKPYTRKVWTVEPLKMSPNWVGSRVAKLPQEKLESLCAMDNEELSKADFGWGPNATFSFPTYGGTGAVWKHMAEKLPQNWFRYNSQVVDIDYETKQVKCRKAGSDELDTISYDALINTAPIDLLVQNTKICPELNVEHNKVFIVGVGLKLPMPEFCEKFTWLYFPDREVPFYRVTFFSRYGEVTPDNSKYWSVMCECARQPDDPITEEEMRELAVEGLITKSVITREQIVTVYSITLPYGYPIPTVQRDSELARAHRALEKNSIYSRGRFGGWKYEVSNQDHCFIQGRELIDRLVLNEPEKLYKTGVDEKRG